MKYVFEKAWTQFWAISVAIGRKTQNHPVTLEETSPCIWTFRSLCFFFLHFFIFLFFGESKEFAKWSSQSESSFQTPNSG
jgi:hypothetical protein